MVCINKNFHAKAKVNDDRHYDRHKTLLPAIQNRKSGTPERRTKVISEAQMDVAYREFWAKRGLEPVAVCHGGIYPSVSDFQEELSLMELHGGTRL